MRPRVTHDPAMGATGWLSLFPTFECEPKQHRQPED